MIKQRMLSDYIQNSSQIETTDLVTYKITQLKETVL